MRERSNHRRGREAGFTLIEMMVVVAIIAVLSLMFISLSSRTYGTNAESVADELGSQLQFLHTRSVSTRRWHCAEVKPQEVILYQSMSTGMTPPTTCSSSSLASGTPTTSTPWQRISNMIINNGTSVWMVDSSIDKGTGNSVTQNTALDSFQLVFKPDGSSTGGTVFITDTTGSRQNRVIVYSISGDVYQRKGW